MSIFKKPILKKLSLVMILSTAVLIPAYASPASDLRNLLQPISSLKTKFTQTVVNKKSKMIQKFTGNLEFKRPKLFRWQIDSPEQSLIVTDGMKIWNYDVQLEQVTVQNFKSNNEVSPISFLFDDLEQLNKDFNIVIMDSPNSFRLKPKQENASFVSVDLKFDDKTIKELVLLDHLGQISTFSLEDVQNNPNIANDRFKFNPPAGVDVIGEL